MTASDAPATVTLDKAATEGAGRLALIPGEDAMVVALDLPDRLRGPAREQVARRQAADRLGLRPDQIELRPVATGSTGFRRVVVADAARMAALRTRLGGAGLAGLVPDYLALPAAEGLWVLQTGGGRVVARLGRDDGFAAEIGLALAQLDLALAQARPRAALRLGAEDDTLDGWLAAQEVTVAPDLDAAARHLPQPPKLADPAGVDFLADPQAAADRMARRLSGWLRIAALLVVAAGCAAAALVLETRSAQAVAALARAEAEEMARRTLLPSGPILDLRAQLSRRLAEIAPGAAAADGQVPVAALLRRAAAPLAGSDPRSAVYRPPGRIAVELDLADFAAVEALAERLRAAGLDVIVASAGADAASGQVRALLDLGVAP